MSSESGITHPSRRHQWSDLAAIAVFAVMLVEMLVPIKSTTSIKALLLFIGVCVLSERRPLISRGLLLFALPAGAYAATAWLTGAQYNVVRVDVINVIQVGIFMALVGTAQFDDDRRERFYASLHVSFLLVGLAAAGCGLTKLLLDTRGLRLGFLFDAENRYPAGSALQMDYNTFMMALILALSSALWLVSRTRNRLILHVCFMGWPVLVGAIVLTGSRRALIFLAIGLLVWLVDVLWQRSSRVEPRAGRSVAANRSVLGFYFLFVLVSIYYTPPVRNSLTELMTSSEAGARLDRSSTVGNVDDLFETRKGYLDYAMDQIGGADVIDLIIGKGFSYVTEFGHIAGVGEDYPHNFVFSSMLYGGATQTLVLMGVIAMGLFRAVRTTLSGRFLFFWLLVAVMFLLSSSNSFFSSELGLAVLVLALDTPGKQRFLTDPYSSSKQPSAVVDPLPSRTCVPLL